MHTRARVNIARLIAANIFLVFISASLSAKSQVEFEEDFVDPSPNEYKWNFCQRAEHLNDSVPDQSGQPKSAYRLGIDALWEEPKCNCNRRSKCGPTADEEADYYEADSESDEETPLIVINSLAPSEIRKLRKKVNDQCDGYQETTVPIKGNKKVQKNEVRLWGEDWPDAATGHWISFRFKIDGVIESCHSKRWVGGQFKAAKMDDSPFVAQRFDNSVFHITIEAPHRTDKKFERIIVAKAPGNPDLTIDHLTNSPKATTTCDYSKGFPEPKSCGFAGKVTTYGKNLPSTKNGDWVQMDYYLKIAASYKRCKPQDCSRHLEVWADGDKIAEVTGRFGVKKAHKSKLNIKLGVYRNQQPGDAGFIIDNFSIRSDPDRQWSPKKRISIPE